MPGRFDSVTLFHSNRERYGRPKRWDFCELELALSRARLAHSKAELPLWVPATFQPGATRAAAAVDWVHFLVWDYDDGTPIEEALGPWMQWPWVLHTTWGHTPKHPKFRLILPLECPVPGADWKHRAWPEMRRYAAGGPDSACKDPSRMYYLPGAPTERMRHFVFRSFVPAGRGVLLAAELAPKQEPKPPSAPRPRRCLPHGAAQRLRSARLKKDPRTRLAAAAELHARVSGERAFGIACPSCGRPDVYFFISPHQRQRARCNHVNSCGWTGHLAELLEAA